MSPPITIIANPSVTYRPMSGRGSAGVPSIGGSFPREQISADHRPMYLRTSVDNRPMLDRHISVFDRCIADRCNWHRPDIGRRSPMPPESPGHRTMVGRQPVQNYQKTHRKHIVYSSEYNVTGVTDYSAGQTPM